MQIQATENVSFQYKSILKSEFRAGNIPLKKDITGALLKRGEETVDHTIPKSKGGKSNLFNYSLMSEKANKTRGNKPLKSYIDLESFIEYVKVMLNVKTDDLDGVEYLKGWLPNILKAIKENK
jgi:hypothetical protein